MAAWLASGQTVCVCVGVGVGVWVCMRVCVSVYPPFLRIELKAMHPQPF